MEKINIFLGKYGLIIFIVSIILFVTFLEEINSEFVLMLFPIYVISGTFYLGFNQADYLDYLSSMKDKTQSTKVGKR